MPGSSRSGCIFSFFGSKVVLKYEGKKLKFYDVAYTADDVLRAVYDVNFFWLQVRV